MESENIEKSENLSQSFNSESFFENNAPNNNDNDNSNILYPSRLSIDSSSNFTSSVITNFNLSFSSESSNSKKNANKKKKEKQNSIKAKYIFCKKCKNFYIIDIEKNNFIKFECDCMEIDNCSINRFTQEFITKDKDFVEKNSGCKKHENKKYCIYCEDCKMDLCNECLNETKIYNNTKIIIKKHETHTTIKLEKEINEEIEKINSILKIIKYNIPEGYIDFRRILNLIIILITKNNTFYCYNLYKSLVNIFNFLSKFEFPLLKKMIKIKTIKEFKDNLNDDNSIISIQINRQNFSDLSPFKGLRLDFLTELELNENDIEDISPLANCSFKNLRIFNIEINELNNDCLDILKIYQFPNLIRLNLYQNNIKSTYIFDIVKNFTNLESFFIGENRFDKNELDKNRIYDLPPKLKEFELTGNITEETADFIPKIKIEKLKIFYVSRNHLKTLSFLKKVKFKNLEEFWASSNNITDLNEISLLQLKESIKKIDLKGNKITNIDNIIEIASQFKSLKEINLEDNQIEINNDSIIKELKAKGIQLKI